MYKTTFINLIKPIIMKKHFIILSLFAFICIGCNIDEPKSDYPKESTEQNELTKDKLILELQELNDSLIQSQQTETRGRLRNFFRKICNIVVADVKGGFSGATIGSKVGGKVGAWICGVVTAIGDSYKAGVTEFSRATMQGLSIEEIEAAYSQTIYKDIDISETEYIKLNANLKLPTEFKYTTEMGRLHNLTLTCIDSGDYSLTNYTTQLTKPEILCINCEEFRSFYNTDRVFNIEEAIINPSKEEQVIQLFIEAFLEYPEDSEDVTQLINNYIDKIEADNSISPEKRETIYYALSIAAYSTEYWKEKFESQNQ